MSKASIILWIVNVLNIIAIVLIAASHCDAIAWNARWMRLPFYISFTILMTYVFANIIDVCFKIKQLNNHE